MLLGMIAGVIMAVTMAVCGYGKYQSIHAGIYALGLNLTIVLAGSFLAARKAPNAA